jgi:uncharacterized protein YceH (UPF0502 family)
MSLSQGAVQHTARILAEKKLVMIEEGARRGVEKYKQRFCNTRFSELQFDSAQFAIICLLFLRGPQTPGELRAHSGRLHEFADNNAVSDTLQGLIERDEPLVVQLPRTPGRKDSEYMHLFSGPIDIEAYAETAREKAPSPPAQRSSISDLDQRVSDLEAQVSELREMIENLL